MADFVSREKEFRKLNDKLDDDYKRSTTQSKIEKFKEARQNPLTSICYDTYRVRNMGGGSNSGSGGNSGNSGNGVNGGHSDRFATYTKEKCSTLNSMRKVGGGDCVVLPIKPKSPPSPKKTTTTTTLTKSSYGNNFQYRAKSLPKGTAPNCSGLGGYGVGALAKDTLERRQPKIYAEQVQNSSRPSATMTTSLRKTATAAKDTIVVYKNEKFSFSSSMDDIIKRNLELTSELEEDNYKRNALTNKSCINAAAPVNAESMQPLESLRSCGSKSAQKTVQTGSLIRFLKSKVLLLEENQARNMEEMTQQKEAYEATLERHKSLTQQLEKALNRNSTLTEQLEKTNSQLCEANQRYREQSQECLALKKELENVKRELKQLTLNYTNLEKRYARTKEETENVQKSCTSMRQGERDLKETFRRETEAKNAEIKYLKKQRSDLFNAYKKQLFLIDNLRQQNICMEQAKMIDFCEKEFSKILDWNLQA